MRIIVLASAQDDVDEIRHWYREHESGVDVLFQLELDAVFDRIARFPLTFQVAHARFRRALVTRFPYAVYFVAGSRNVHIVAVVHTSRDPRVWRRRS